MLFTCLTRSMSLAGLILKYWRACKCAPGPLITLPSVLVYLLGGLDLGYIKFEVLK